MTEPSPISASYPIKTPPLTFTPFPIFAPFSIITLGPIYELGSIFFVSIKAEEVMPDFFNYFLNN